MEANNEQNVHKEQNNAPTEVVHDIEYIIQSKVSKAVRSIKQYLSNPEFITEKGDQKTNIMNVAEKKTYHLQQQHMEEFFSLLEACRKENRTMQYSERQETSMYGHSGIMIDFDRYQSSKDTTITSGVLDILISRLTSIISETIDFAQYAQNDQFVYHIFIIKKTVPDLVPGQTPAVYKDGFHLLIPELQVIKGYKKFLLSELKERKTLQSMFRGVPSLESDPPDKALDMMSASVPVYFFGSAKPGKNMYPLAYAYEVRHVPIDNLMTTKVLDVKTLLSGKSVPSDDKIPVIDINLAYELSLSVQIDMIAGKPTWLRKQKIDFKVGLEQRIQLLTEKTVKDILCIDELQNTDRDVDTLSVTDPQAKHLRDLLGLLDLTYATEYDKWIKVIFAIGNTSARYKDLAVWFSQRKPEQWSPGELDKIWEDAIRGTNDKKPLTIRSIDYWARESSPDKYKQVKESHYKYDLQKLAIENDGRVEHAIAAKVLWSMIGSKFVVDVDKNDAKAKKDYIWYEFVLKGQAMEKGEIYKWRQESSPDNVHLYITEHLPKVYREVGRFIKDRREGAENENDAKYWSNVDKTFRMYTSKLHNDGFQEGIIKQARYRFRTRGFISGLDSRADCLGVGNGVLVVGAKPQLVTGYNELCISKYTPTDYIPYDPENPQIKILMQAFRDIFPENDMCEFILFHSSLSVANNDSKNYLLTLVGGGQNGKSFLYTLKHQTLGEMYSASGKPALLTSSNEKGNEANSALMALKGKRDFYFDEFAQNERLNVARVKSIVNPGYQSARELHKKQENFISKCNPVAISNFDFIIDTTDHGTWRRILYYRNKIKFCAKPQGKFEKKVDPRFMDVYTKDPLFLSAFLSILVHYYARLQNEYGGDITKVIQNTPTLLRETLNFRTRQDTIMRFITTMIVKSPSAEDIGLSIISSKYIEWFNKTVNQQCKLNLNDVMTQIENSKLQSEIRNKHGILVACGVRVKSYLEEPLREDESNLVEIGDNNIKDIEEEAKQPLFAGELPRSLNDDADKSNELDKLDDLTRNTKLWIQKTENPIAQITEEDIIKMVEAEKANVDLIESTIMPPTNTIISETTNDNVG